MAFCTPCAVHHMGRMQPASARSPRQNSRQPSPPASQRRRYRLLSTTITSLFSLHQYPIITSLSGPGTRPAIPTPCAPHAEPQRTLRSRWRHQRGQSRHEGATHDQRSRGGAQGPGPNLWCAINTLANLHKQHMTAIMPALIQSYRQVRPSGHGRMAPQSDSSPCTSSWRTTYWIETSAASASRRMGYGTCSLPWRGTSCCSWGS